MPLKRAALFVVVLLMACRKPAPQEPAAPAAFEVPVVDPSTEPDDPKVWRVYSPDTHTSLSQALSTQGRCELTCQHEKEPQPAWRAVAVPCIGQKLDWRFVANDCERVVVIDPAPSKANGWRAAVVMRIYKRDKLDYQVTGPGVIRDERKVMNQPSWVQGSFGVPGEPPHYSADGAAVELTSVDGKAQRVPLVATDKP